MANRQRAQAARTIVTKCLALLPDSEVAIIADETTWGMARLLADAATESNCRPLLMFFSQSYQQSMSPESLGESVKAVLRDVAASIVCVNGSAACLPFRDWVRRAAWGRERKVAHMPGATWHTFLIADADYARITRQCEGLALALAKGNEIVIQSFDHARGEHILRAQLRSWERLPIISDGIIRSGAWGNVPSGETYVAPIEGTAEGEIVINGSLPGMVLSPHHELVLEFHAGRLERLSPRTSRAARHLMKTQIEFASERGDANWGNLAEIGLGTHEGIRRLTGSPLLDEKKYGSLHIALGDNIDMGGQSESLIHCDMVCLKPKAWIDGRLVVANGKIVLNEADWRENYRVLELPADWRADAFVAPTVIEADVDEAKRLRRYWDTSAGGMCSVPVGNDATARQAATVWRMIKENGPAIQLPKLFARWRETGGDGWDRRDLDRLVRLLETYGLVQLSAVDGEQEG